MISPTVAAEAAKLRPSLIEVSGVRLLDVEQSHNSQSQLTRESIQQRLYSGLRSTRVGLGMQNCSQIICPKVVYNAKRDPDAPVNERASAAYLGKDYTEAERLFLKWRPKHKKEVRPGQLLFFKRCN